MNAPKRHAQVGKWMLEKLLGRGGNGEVWLATDSAGGSSAIKLLMKLRPVPYARFKDEVAALKLVAGVEGILPLLDSDLRPELDSGRPWYAMPLATPLLHAVEGFSARKRIEAVAEVAETMAQLHARGIAHRDIKPGNLLLYEGRCHIGDFGLVDYPDKTDLTAPREQLGPRWTMAPEMRRDGDTANPIPADVYSLAKTLWIVITGDENSFDGQYDAEGDLSIRKYCGDLYITPLEELLSESTNHRPERRPLMKVFAQRIREWLRVSAQFPEHNRLQWIEVQRRLFPLRTPTRAIWGDEEGIISVLNILGETSNLNHLFFPEGGGLDLERVVRSEREPGCVELIAGGIASIVRPARLFFESFDADPQWNYFRLETGGLEPSGVYADIRKRHAYEELTDVGGHTYADRACWDAGEYNGKRLPRKSRVVLRYFEGAFVVFQKTSIYNKNPSTYDGRHNKVSADEFRAYIQRAIKNS